MIIYLYGPDSLRRKRKLDSILHEYERRAGETDLFFADFNEDAEGWWKVRDFLLQPSLFDVTKVAVVHGGGALDEKGWARLLKEERDSERRFLVLSDIEEPRSALKFLLQPPVAAQAFLELEGEAFARFFRAECRGRGLRLTPEHERAALRVLGCVSDRSWRTVHVLDQLSLLIQAGQPSQAAISDLLHILEHEEMYQITRKLSAAPKRAVRLALLEAALAAGDSAYVFNSLAFQVRGEILRMLGDYDISVKSGGLEYEEALADFALRGAA